MTKRDVLSVAFKIIGVMCIYSAALTIPIVIFSLAQIVDRHREINIEGIYLVSFILFAGLAFVLLRYGERIAEKLVPEDSALPTLNIKQQEIAIFQIAVRIIGVICLIKAVSDLFKGLTIYILKTRYYEILSAYEWGELVGAILLIILGGYLLSGGKKLVKFAYKEKPELQREEPEDREN